jgi:S-adenosylmethionine synthetase
VETLLTNGLCVIAGEITTDCYIDIPQIARQIIKEIGYTDAAYGFDYATCGVLTSIQEQSRDIARGVGLYKKESPEKLGAGDQGMMYGYAADETPELMPLPIVLAHRLTKKLAEIRKAGILPYLRPDGKSQVTVEYENDRPKRIENILVSCQHSAEVNLKQIKKDIIEKIILPLIPRELLDSRTKYFVNPTGRFVTGGPKGDTGLTGRKIIVDTYGGVAPHGGGAFSGKDPTKVDRSGAYGARYIAKNIVAAGLSRKAEIQVAYAIGVPEPLAINVRTFNTGKIPDENIARAVKKIFDLRPGMLIKNLKLRRPIYRQIAAYGHFGRPELDLPWEKTDKIAELKRILKI